MSLKRFIIEIILISTFGAACLSLHFIPNHYCQAVFNLPCEDVGR